MIGRLGNNGFLIKGWAITVTGVFFGFGVDSDNWRLGVVSVLLILTFWGVDAYFLRSERLFRQLYSAVVDGRKDIPVFYMGLYAATEGERPLILVVAGTFHVTPQCKSRRVR